MTNDKFERIEKKFWMIEHQYRQLEKTLSEHMEPDQYGKSLIRNIYCDTDDYALTRRSIERPLFKEKLRIRSYSGFEQDSKVFVEIKRKVKEVGYKRRIEVPFSQAMLLLSGQETDCGNPQIEKEIYEFIRRYRPKPKVYLTYERVAMTGKNDPDLRITFDRNIKYREYEDGFDFTKDGACAIDEKSKVLMEVKAHGGMPPWLINELSRLQIYHCSFSKIGTCFTLHIAPELKFGCIAPVVPADRKTAPVSDFTKHPRFNFMSRKHKNAISA